MSRSFNQRTVAGCVLGGHETPRQDRHGCPLVQALIRKVQDMGIADAPEDIERELDKYRTVARVLECPLVARLAAEDLVAIVAARELSLRSDWTKRPEPLIPALA
jgi:hypothetical protein